MEREELLEIAIKERKAYEKSYSGSNDNWTLVSKDGNVIKNSGACLGRLLFRHNGEHKETALFVSNPFAYLHIRYVDYSRYPVVATQVQKKKRSMRVAESTYLNWLVNDSVWSPLFLDKNLRKIFISGAILNCDYDARYVVQASINMRLMQEYRSRFPNTFYTLQKHCHPDLAFVLAHSLVVKGKIISISPMNGHCWIMERVFDGAMGFTISECVNLLNRTPDPTPHHKFSKSTVFKDLRQYWGKDDKKEKTVHQLIAPIYNKLSASISEKDTLGLPIKSNLVPVKYIKELVSEIEKALIDEQDKKGSPHCGSRLWLCPHV